MPDDPSFRDLMRRVRAGDAQAETELIQMVIRRRLIDSHLRRILDSLEKQAAALRVEADEAVPRGEDPFALWGRVDGLNFEIAQHRQRLAQDIAPLVEKSRLVAEKELARERTDLKWQLVHEARARQPQLLRRLADREVLDVIIEIDCMMALGGLDSAEWPVARVTSFEPRLVPIRRGTRRGSRTRSAGIDYSVPAVVSFWTRGAPPGFVL
jgi:hypothetical protein